MLNTKQKSSGIIRIYPTRLLVGFSNISFHVCSRSFSGRARSNEKTDQTSARGSSLLSGSGHAPPGNFEN